jgi:FAD synthetase
VSLDKKSLLGAVFSASLLGSPTPKGVAGVMGADPRWVHGELRKLAEGGFVRLGREVRLTHKGRGAIRVVFIGGGFEVLHQGHLHTIESAKGLGDVLVVSVARDSTIRRRKKREPVADENARVKMLSSLRQVDAALLGVEGDIYETLEKVKPDVVALGYDQYHMESEVEGEARKRGMDLEVVRLDSPVPGVKTSALLAEL